MYVNGVSTIGNTTTSASSATNSSISMEDFYKLLTTELQNQDPTDPVDTSTMISQTASYGQLEKLDDISDDLGKLLLYQQSMNNGQAVSFLGKTVTVDSDQLSLTDGTSGDIQFQLAGDASDVTVSIYNADGTLVRKIDGGALSAGTNTLEWNGRDDDGNSLPDGDYTFSVSAMDGSGAAVEATTLSTSEVTGITFEDGIAYLQLENGTVPVGSVVEVYGS